MKNKIMNSLWLKKKLILNSSALGKIVTCVISLCLIQLLNACMPKASDDFSVLGNDVFSNLIRDSYSDVNLTPGNSFGALGIGRIDKGKAISLSTKIFIKQRRSEVINLFGINGGQCKPEDGDKTLHCEVTRKWKLKNIGANFDTTNWSDPIVKLEFIFSFKEQDQVTYLHLNITDITEYKKLRD